MSKTILITESQKKTLLYESVNEEFTDIIKRNYDFVKDVVTQASEQMGVNLQFLITWGASIGGFIGPLNEFIQGRFPELTEEQITLILTGIIATYYIDNKKMVVKILNEIKSKGIMGEFTSVLRKSSQLKETFVEFVNSLNITLHKVTNIMSYAFLIPLIPIIYNSAVNQVISSSDVKEIALRISAFGLLTVSGIAVKELFSKLIKRFSRTR
jgi:uncharacterized membrane protein